MDSSTFAQDGYLITSPLLSEPECQALDANLSSVAVCMAGNRSLLDAGWCRALAGRLRQHPSIARLLPQDAVAVQCTLFEKSLERNWLVALHQDLSIPVAAKVDHPALSGWSSKEGSLFVQPPAEVLRAVVALRLHVDDCGSEDGPLKVVPGSHAHGRISPEAALALRAARGEVVCPVARGAALLMTPLLLHSSSKSSGHSRRRVLHFLFAPPSLPFGLRWRHAV